MTVRSIESLFGRGFDSLMLHEGNYDNTICPCLL
nr:MAG TPA: hypothetical protein [Caudoviricetes sp.]